MVLTILVAVALGSVVSLIGGIILVGLPQRYIRRGEHLFVAFAAGALLATAALDLLPEAFEADVSVAPFALLVGIVAFFLVERGLHWLHHHRHEPDDSGRHSDRTVPLIIISDTLHNFIDGAAIAISFLASPELGVLTAVAVGLHEIPQEIGDFAILLTRGYSRAKALWINVLSALGAFLGAAIAYVLADYVEGLLPWLLAGTAGMFLYISLSNLIPDLHREHDRGLAWLEAVVLLAAIAIVAVVIGLTHHHA